MKKIMHHPGWITVLILCICSALIYIFMTGCSFLALVVFGIAVILAGFLLLFGLRNRNKKLGSILLVCFACLVGIGFLAAVFTGILIGSAAKGDTETPCDYIIVLGAGVNGTVPSMSLQDRIDAAYDYLAANPGCIGILSGGQGPGEDISEAQCMAERLINDDSIKHGRVVIGFTPDEEIGRGADFFDVQRFGAQFAYTVDGAAFGEIDYETFNAISAQVKINGNAIHPGEAKGKMINASLLAMEFNGMLPCAQRPEYTDGYEGFFHLCEMNGNVEKATMNYILRDHDQSALNRRLSTMQSVAAFMNERYGINTVKLNCRMQYQNMAEKVLQHRYVLDIASDAIRDMGVFPVSRPIRGGTDGARLSFMGLVCPNLGTGSHNHHSCREFASIQEMNKCSELLARIAQKAVEINWKK